MKQSRPETGPMQFGDDWRGIFIRGDTAGWMAMKLKSLLDDSGGWLDAVEMAEMWSLQSLLASSDHHAEANVQRVKAWIAVVDETGKP